MTSACWQLHSDQVYRRWIVGSTIRRNDFEPSDNLIDKSLLATIHAMFQNYECISLFGVIAAVREISS